MKFSILIANYNNGKFFKDCYNSILAQTYTDWEAIIVDDASTDDSVAVINNLIKGDIRFKIYFNANNMGCGFTKRKCAELATGDICGYLDPDDALTPDALQRSIEPYQSPEDIVLTHSHFFYCNPALEITGRSNKTSKAPYHDVYFFNLTYQIFHFVSFLRKSYLQTEGIDSYLLRAVDQDLYLKMAEKGKFAFVNAPLYFYRVHNNSLSSGEKSTYWHWYVIMAAAKRRNINVENEFVNAFIARKKYEHLAKAVSKSRSLKVSNFIHRIKYGIKK